MTTEEELLRKEMFLIARIVELTLDLMACGKEGGNNAINLSLLAAAQPLNLFGEIAGRILFPAMYARLRAISDGYVPNSLADVVVQEDVNRLLQSLDEEKQ